MNWWFAFLSFDNNKFNLRTFAEHLNNRLKTMNQDTKSLLRCSSAAHIGDRWIITNYYEKISLNISTLLIVVTMWFLLKSNETKTDIDNFECVSNVFYYCITVVIINFWIRVIQHSFCQISTLTLSNLIYMYFILKQKLLSFLSSNLMRILYFDSLCVPFMVMY